MSVIHLVRHGQAGPSRAAYDQLSELGERQARLAGEGLAARGVTPDVLVTGTMRRQQLTGSRLWEAAGWESDVSTDAGWNEYDHDAIIEAYKPAYRNHAVMRADLARHRHPRKAFQEMFVAAASRWASGDFDDDYPETFSQFRDRVALALGRVTSSLESGRSAVVVSSGGPIAWVAAGLLTAPSPASTLPAALPDGAATVWRRLNEVTVNTGVTTVLAGSALTAVSLNDHAHLGEDRSLITYR